MGLMVLKIMACLAGVAACFCHAYNKGVEHGLEDGAANGYVMALKDICDGGLVVDGRTLIFNDTCLQFHDPSDGSIVRKMDMDGMEFEEIN